MKNLIILLIVSSSLAVQAKSFNCDSLLGEDLLVIISDDGREIIAQTGPKTAPVNAESYVGDKDDSYKPKQPGAVRFLVRESGSDKTKIILNSKMAQGQPGKMRIEGSTDSYWSQSYSCQ